MKKFLLTMIVTMLSFVGAWGQYGITYNGTSATITDETSGMTLDAIISDINTSHSDVVNFSLPSTWTKEQVNTFAQGVTNKKSVSKDTYGSVDVWSYIDPKTSASTSYTGTVYAGSAIGKSGDNYGKLNSYSVVPTAENISYVKSGTTDVYTVSETTPILYQDGNEYGVENGNLIGLYVAYMNGSEKYTGELMALEGGNAYGNTGSAVEVTTANVPYTYNTGGFDYVYLSGDVYTSAEKKYYLPNTDEIKALTVVEQWRSYSATGAVVNKNDYTNIHGPYYDAWNPTQPYYYGTNEGGTEIALFVLSSYTYDEGIAYAGTVYTKDDVKYGYIGSDSHELTAVNSSLTYETSTNKVYTGRLYKDASDNTVGADGADIALTTKRFSDVDCTVEYTGPATEDNSKGGTDPFLLSKSYTYTYSDLTGTEHTSDPFASKQTQINLSGDELYIVVDNNPIPAKTSSELIVYTTAEGELQTLIDAMTPEEKAAVQTIAINGVISYADATSLSNLSSAKVFDVTNATGSLGSINVSGVVIASDAAAITTTTNLTAVVTPVDATTVDMVKGSASTIDAEALEMALAGKQTVNIKNPDVNSTIVNTSLIDKLPSNITKVSIADNTFGGSQANIAVSNTNITEFDASNARGAYGKLTLNLSACTGLTTVNLLNSLLPESENVIGTLTLPNKPLTVMCTAAEKAQVKTLLGGNDSNITYVVPAVKFAVSIADGLSVNHDKTIELSVIESAITVEADGYDALVKGTDYSLVVKQNGNVVPVEGLDAFTFDNGEHSVTSIPFTVEVTSLNSDLYTDADVANGNITLTHKKSFTLALSFEGSKTSISANSSETAQINATSKDTESEAAINVEYTYRSSDESLATVSSSGLVTAVRGSSDPITITVTAAPIGDDAANYAPMTETISIEVTQPEITLTKTTIEGNEYIEVNIPEGGALGDFPSNPVISGISNATFAELLSAKYVKVTGNITNKDVQAILFPNNNQNGNILTLDLGGSTINTFEKAFENPAADYSFSNTLQNLTLPLVEADGEGNVIVPANAISVGYTNTDCPLNSVTVPDGYTELGANAFKGQSKVTTFNLPSSLLSIGESAFENCGGITSIDFPNNLNYIGKRAFVATNLESVECPASLRKIDDAAFADLASLHYITLNEGLVYIGNSAFIANSKDQSQEVMKVPSTVKYIGPASFEFRWYKDVYFYGDNAPIMPIGDPVIASSTSNCTAFPANTLMGNNGFTPSANERSDNANIGYANRENYHTHDYYFSVLHFPTTLTPEQAETYTDITRKYEATHEYIGTTDFAYNSTGAGLEKAVTVGEHDDELFTKLGASGSELRFGIATLTMKNYAPSGFYDTYQGKQKIWPSQVQWNRSYVLNSYGYKWNGVDVYRPELTVAELKIFYEAGYLTLEQLNAIIGSNSDETKIAASSISDEDLHTLYDNLQKIAYLGTRQFVLVDADTDNPDYTIDVEKGKWWTICLPFNMTKKEVDEVFGENTHVCLFSGVERDVESENKKITLRFQHDVYAHKTEKTSLGTYAANFDIEAAPANDNDIVIQAHEAYMIWPATVEDDPVFVVHNYQPVMGNVLPTYVIANQQDGYAGSDHAEYRFVGNYNEVAGSEQVDDNWVVNYTKVPIYNYIYASKSADRHDLQFWFSQNAGINWKANKCVVQPVDGGASDNENLFTVTPQSPTPAKQRSIFGWFNDDEEETAIESVTIIAGDGENSEVVYNLNGQKIKNPTFAGQIFIKNGKKYINR